MEGLHTVVGILMGNTAMYMFGPKGIQALEHCNVLPAGDNIQPCCISSLLMSKYST